MKHGELPALLQKVEVVIVEKLNGEQGESISISPTEFFAQWLLPACWKRRGPIGAGEHVTYRFDCIGVYTCKNCGYTEPSFQNPKRRSDRDAQLQDLVGFLDVKWAERVQENENGANTLPAKWSDAAVPNMMQKPVEEWLQKGLATGRKRRGQGVRGVLCELCLIRNHVVSLEYKACSKNIRTRLDPTGTKLTVKETNYHTHAPIWYDTTKRRPDQVNGPINGMKAYPNEPTRGDDGTLPDPPKSSRFKRGWTEQLSSEVGASSQSTNLHSSIARDLFDRFTATGSFTTPTPAQPLKNPTLENEKRDSSHMFVELAKGIMKGIQSMSASDETNNNSSNNNLKRKMSKFQKDIERLETALHHQNKRKQRGKRKDSNTRNDDDEHGAISGLISLTKV